MSSIPTLKSQISRLSKRIPNDRGNIGLTVMVGTVLMMLATYAAVKALGPALHTISARSDIRRAGTLSNLANSYIAQTGDMQPTIAKLVSAGLLPSGAKGVCSTCGGVGTYTTNDGSVLSMVPGGSAGIFGMTLLPGPNMAQDMNYYLSHLTGSIQNGSTVAWNQPVPAIANLGSRFVQTNPANPGATQSVNSSLSTNGNSINSGNVNSTGSVSAGNGSSYIASDNSGLWRWGPPAIVYNGNWCNCNGYPSAPPGYVSVPAQGVPGGYYNANVIQQPYGCNGFGDPVYNCFVSPVNADQCEVYITSPGGDPTPYAEWLLNVSDPACYRP